MDRLIIDVYKEDEAVKLRGRKNGDTAGTGRGGTVVTWYKYSTHA